MASYLNVGFGCHHNNTSQYTGLSFREPAVWRCHQLLYTSLASLTHTRLKNPSVIRPRRIMMQPDDYLHEDLRGLKTRCYVNAGLPQFVHHIRSVLVMGDLGWCSQRRAFMLTVPILRDVCVAREIYRSHRDFSRFHSCQKLTEIRIGSCYDA